MRRRELAILAVAISTWAARRPSIVRMLSTKKSTASSAA